MLVAVGPMTFALALLAFMPNLWTTALMLSALFFAYYVYEPPYRGLYPDVLPESVFGRAQGVQHVLRGVAIGGALIGGGYLFHAWHPAPFLVAAGVVACACLVPILLVTEDGGHGRVFEGVRTYVAQSWGVLRENRDVTTFLVANTAWEGTFAGARTFVVLYVTVGLDQPLSTSTSILAAVAGGYIVAALVAGRIGDRVGLARVIVVASVVYGTGLVAGGLGTKWHTWYLAAHLPRGHRGRRRDDPRLGAPLQADAARAAGRDLGARDDDEGDRARDRAARGRRGDRSHAAAPRRDRGLPGALAGARAARSSSRSRSSPGSSRPSQRQTGRPGPRSAKPHTASSTT